MTNGKGTCFVVMGFGKKPDFESGRTLDLDKSYRNIVKPAVKDAGFDCVRADEIVHSGLIDVPMYEQLLSADIVVADLSTSNKNAFYELGIRHALRPFTTIVIAEEGLKIPFDVNHIVVRHYKHLGEDIGYDETMRFRGVLTTAINTIAATAAKDRVDSPVYRFVGGLQPPSLQAALQAAAQQAAPPSPPAGAAAAAEVLAAKVSTPSPALESTHSELMKQVDDAMRASDFLKAKYMLAFIRDMAKIKAPQRPEDPPPREDPYFIQQLALATYKSKMPDERSSLLEAAQILKALEPATSNDTETLGLWGAIHKRLWALCKDVACLNEAVRALERGFYLRNDYYNGINLAFLLNVRAAEAREPAYAIADFIQARRVREEVQKICAAWLEDNPVVESDGGEAGLKQQLDTRYWVNATLAEAKVGLEVPDAQQALDATIASAPHDWMASSTLEQAGKLRDLLADSPLKHLKNAGP